MIPKIILYQPNTLKSLVLIYPTKNLMANNDTTKAAIIPIIKMVSSVFVKIKPNFKIFRRLAPNITGIAKKKVNSAAIVLDVPIKIAPIIVAPERDVPGINDKT